MPISVSAFDTVAGGVVLLTATRGLSLPEFRENLRSRLSNLRRSLGYEVKVRAGVRFDVDPLLAVYGDRTMRPADAIVDLAMPGGESTTDLAARMGAFSSLADCIEPDTSALALGTVVHIHRHRPEGGEVLAFLGLRAPSITQDAMLRWWLAHADLSVRLQQGIARPWSYAQLHVDHAASHEAMLIAQIGAMSYDMGDILSIADRKAFLDWSCMPKVARTLEQDEIGALDQTSWRGGLVDVVEEC